MAEKTQQNLILQWITLTLLVILGIGSFTWMTAPMVKIPTAKEIAAEIKLPEAPEATSVDLTNVEEGIADIQFKLDEEGNFKDACEVLAREYIEKEKRSFMKDIAGILKDLDEGDYKDINKIKIRDLIIDDEYDVDEGDCTVIAKLRVYYDSDKEDNVREDVDVRVVIEENEIDDVIVD